MPETGIVTTQQIIAAVYDWLDRPSHTVLQPSVVCTKLWTALGKLQSLLNISDRTHFLLQQEVTVAANQSEVTIPEVGSFGGELGLEVVSRSSGVESTTQVNLISDWRDRDKVLGLAGCIFRNESGGLRLRFNAPLAETCTMRLWYEPGSFGRPKLGETPLLPDEGMNLLIIETAYACATALAGDSAHYRAVVDNLQSQLADFRQIYKTWTNKDRSAGVKKRRGYHQRGLRRTGAQFNYGGGE